MVERQPSKLNVAGSNPVSRSLFIYRRCSSGVERFLGKEEAMSSNLIIGSTGSQVVTLLLSINNNSLRYYIGIFDCFFVPILFIHFYRNTIALPSHDDHMLNICRANAQHMLFDVIKDEQI